MAAPLQCCTSSFGRIGHSSHSLMIPVGSVPCCTSPIGDSTPAASAALSLFIVSYFHHFHSFILSVVLAASTRETPPLLPLSVLSANNFTGSIPETFGKLTNLTAFGIDGSSLSGKIPDFIGNWTKITRLDMQGTSMEGPIPNISNLTELAELRITDLSGSSSTDFPDLQDMKNLQRLLLICFFFRLLDNKRGLI